MFFFLPVVPKDSSPQWRKVAWSPDCALLAYADSTGTVRVFDLMGSELFVIPPVTRPLSSHYRLSLRDYLSRAPVMAPTSFIGPQDLARVVCCFYVMVCRFLLKTVKEPVFRNHESVFEEHDFF